MKPLFPFMILIILIGAYFLYSANEHNHSKKHMIAVETVKLFIKVLLVETNLDHRSGVVQYKHSKRILREISLRKFEGSSFSSMGISVDIDFLTNKCEIKALVDKGQFQNNKIIKVNQLIQKLKAELNIQGFVCTHHLLNIKKMIKKIKQNYFPLSRLVFKSMGCEVARSFTLEFKEDNIFLSSYNSTRRSQEPLLAVLKVTEEHKKRINKLIYEFKIFQSEVKDYESTSHVNLILYDQQNKEILNSKDSSGDYNSGKMLKQDNFIKLVQYLEKFKANIFIGEFPLSKKP